MNREFLREIEEKYGWMLEGWSRTDGLRSEHQFVLPKVLPPEEFVIQGLRRPERPSLKRAERRNREFQNRRKPSFKGEPRFKKPSFEREICPFCDFSDKTNGRCLIKMVNGGDCLFGRGRR
jgi:hypothetical protein